MIYREMARTLPAVACLAGGLLLGACGGSSLLSQDPEAEITIRSAVDGQTLSASDAIVLSAAGGAGPQPDRLAVSISSADGAAAGDAAIDDLQRGVDLRVSLSPFDLRPGEYRAHFTLQSGGAAVAEKSLAFFVGPAAARMNGIESRPPIICTGAQVELSVDLAAVQGIDPFLRWTENRRTFASGLASSGGARVSWQAPREPGVYTIRVEMFPVAPAGGADFPFTSSLRATTELYVSAPARVQSLGPAESYWMLYDLDGSLGDSTRDSLEAAPVGVVEPVAGADVFGYRLAAPSGIRIARSLVPEEPLPGFTVSIGLALSEVVPGARILTSAGDPPLLSIMVGQDGSPTAILSCAAGESVLPSGLAPLHAGDRHHLDLSFVGAEGRWFAMWFVDGEPGAVAALGDGPWLAASGRGETLIGGPGGITGVVDELGVFRAGPDPEVFSRAMSLRYGDSLLLADGFDGSRLDSRYQADGQVSVSLGRLVLAPGSSVELELAGPAEGEIVLEAASDRALEVGWRGRTLNLTAGAPRAAEERTRVRIRPQDGGAGGYRLALANRTDGPLAVASLLAYVD